MDGMLLNSMAFLHALTAALVDDWQKAFLTQVMHNHERCKKQDITTGKQRVLT